MTDKWLPIGSVVLLEDGNRLLMIYGRAQRQVDADSKNDVMWDYVGCMFPEGNIDPDHSYLFNKEQIDSVYFIGYQPAEEYELSKQLDELMDAYVSADKSDGVGEGDADE